MILDIEEKFNEVAKDYDKNRRFFIPCFDDFYENSTKIIAENISAPKKIIDLGAGTGLLSYFWNKIFPDAEILLVDLAEEMLAVAKKRFSTVSNVSYEITDYKNNFPEGNFEVIISALSIHHLTDSEKQNLFYKIYKILPKGGKFINYDQFCAESSIINDWYNFCFENQLKKYLTEKDIAAWRERKIFDKECTVSQEINMLKKCKFNVAECIYSNQKFAVIVAIK